MGPTHPNHTAAAAMSHINPAAAALATVAAILAVAVNINDRQLIQACQSNGGNSTVCTLKIVGR